VIVGAHIRTHGGLPSVVPGARAVGADAVQFFASNARQWRHPSITDAAAAEFRRECLEGGVRAAFLHAPYLVNIASPNEEFRRRSIELCRASLVAADQLGARGLVIHSGAGGRGEPAEALARAAGALDEIAEVDSDAWPVVELMAGTAGAVASTIAEAVALFDAVGAGVSDRLRLCLDTCHLFATGYALDTPDGVRSCFEELRGTALASRLVAVHANDAAFPRGSRRDRHANVGTGGIGAEGFATILAQPEVRDCAVMCETPGDEAARRRDVTLLKELSAAH
jgi:deoxyribonuclease-4